MMRIHQLLCTALGATLLLAFAAPATATAQAAEPATTSLLDRLPRVGTPGQYPAALAAAEARGAAGRADALWLQFFYGDAAAKQLAETRLRAAGAPGAATPPPAAEDAELAFLDFLSSYSQGQDRAMLQAALRLARLAPNDVATELAVRTLSGQLENQGRALLDAVPQLRQSLERPLANPTTVYMMGRSLLAAVRAPGVTLSPDQALQLGGQLRHWQLWGPFGNWQNSDFDTAFPIEKSDAASYPDGSATRTPMAYQNLRGGINFPPEWNDRGVEYAVAYVHVAAATAVDLRLYSPSSAALSVNGVMVLRNDRRTLYTPATGTAALELGAGWSRVVVKLGGDGTRTFDLVMRAAPGVSLTEAPTAPARLAAAPTLLPPPVNLATWAAARLARDGDDVVALWVDGIRRVQDEDADTARVELEHAAQLAPNAAVVGLELAAAYSQMDASQSWAASKIEQTAQRALSSDPTALRAYDRLGQVLDSEGKQNEAALQYAHCAGKGFADCDWSLFRLATGQHWLPEAETALGHALAESGSNWSAIGEGLDFYNSMGEAAKVAQWEQVLRGDPRADAALGQYYLRHSRPALAVPLLRTAAAADPSQPGLLRQYLEALLLGGDLAEAQSAATAALAAFPHNGQIAATADEIALRQSPAQGVAALRQTDFNRNALRHEADFLTGDKFWQPWYRSAQDVIRDAPGKAEYPNASAILVFDQMVNRVNPDSTQDAYIHEVYRILNAGGIDLHGDQSIPPGSDLITVRTIKADGTTLLPEKIANLSSITMPGLEAGDYVETEYVMHTPASTIVPGMMDNSQFFVFNSSREPYHYSDLVVLTPPSYPLLVDQTHYPEAPTTQSMANGWTAREWLIQKTRLLVTEPNMPPEQDLVPKVWISSPMTWDDISQYVADHEFDVRRATSEMQAQAASIIAGKTSTLERATAIFDWVAANIQPADGSMLVPAGQYFTDRAGNRMALLLGMLSAAHVPYQLVLARAATDQSSTKIPSLFQFQYPLVHVDAGNATDPTTGWFDLNNEFARPGYIIPAIRGGLALVAGATGDAAFIHVPAGASTLDGVVTTITGAVDDTGAAKLQVQMEFRGPNGEQIRDALRNQPDSRLPQIYQQLILSSYPNATATGGHVDHLADRDQALVITIDATIPDFVHADASTPGASWEIEHLIGPVGMLARWAPLPFREEPLIIPGDSFEQAHVTLTLPAKFAVGALPAAADVNNPFGQFSSSFQQNQNQIVFSRTLYLKSNAIAPGQYAAFRNFGEAVDNQDRLRLAGTVK